MVDFKMEIFLVCRI